MFVSFCPILPLIARYFTPKPNKHIGASYSLYGICNWQEIYIKTYVFFHIMGVKNAYNIVIFV